MVRTRERAVKQPWASTKSDDGAVLSMPVLNRRENSEGSGFLHSKDGQSVWRSSSSPLVENLLLFVLCTTHSHALCLVVSSEVPKRNLLECPGNGNEKIKLKCTSTQNE